MERTLEFRIYWKGVDQMVYFSEATLEQNRDKKYGIFIPSEPGHVFMGNGTVMQYTGLKDKHSEKIFDGDILYYKQHINYLMNTCVMLVCWDENIAGFGYKQRDNREYINPFSEHHELQTDLLDHAEVIGNIYQNEVLFETNNLAKSH